MNIKQIVEERLRKDGFDGLCCDGCGCRLDDLMPCGEPGMDCRPGHIRYGAFEGVENTWIIVEPYARLDRPEGAKETP
jgi:hypothetical protein